MTRLLNKGQFVLQHKWQQLGLSLDLSDFTDAEAVASIMRITNGNLGLFAYPPKIPNLNRRESKVGMQAGQLTHPNRSMSGYW